MNQRTPKATILLRKCNRCLTKMWQTNFANNYSNSIKQTLSNARSNLSTSRNRSSERSQASEKKNEKEIFQNRINYLKKTTTRI